MNRNRQLRRVINIYNEQKEDEVEITVRGYGVMPRKRAKALAKQLAESIRQRVNAGSYDIAYDSTVTLKRVLKALSES